MDYDEIGRGYAVVRRPDPRIEQQLWVALGDARSLVNVGAGAGSYEPRDRRVVAVEPSAEMIAQRPPGAAEVIRARAEALPFADNTFDAAMAVLTIHHWQDRDAGLAELRRVARDRVVILTWIPGPARAFWLYRYLPWVLELDPQRFCSVEHIEAVLGARCEVETVRLPHDCTDGFFCAYWRRPRAYLDPACRRGMSVFGSAELEARAAPGLAALAADLDSGRWEQRFGALCELESVDLGYRLVIARP
jgi:SAM-dependent methyltransferase